MKKILDAVFRRVEQQGAHGAVLVLVAEELQRAAALGRLAEREAVLCQRWEGGEGGEYEKEKDRPAGREH